MALREWITKYVPTKRLLSDGPLFVNARTGGAWTPTSFRRRWEKSCKAAGLPVLKSYESLRHSTATEWLRRGATLQEVQHMLGHKGPHATPRYARLADERFAQIIELPREPAPERSSS